MSPLPPNHPRPNAGPLSGKFVAGMPRFDGPTEIRDLFIEALGLAWVASYIDPANWISSSRTILPRHSTAYQQMRRTNGVLKLMGKADLTLRDPKTNGEPRLAA